MSVAQWLIRRVEFSLEGSKWPLIFSHRALLMCQELTGIDMLSATLGDPSSALVRALLFSALSCAGASCTIEQVGKRITRKNLGKIRDTVCDAWVASMAEPKKEKPQEASEFDAAKKFTWLDAWAIARHDLGLSDDEWLDMTPRQFRALQDARLEQMQREELMVGILAATFENFSMCAPKKPVSPEAFMLHPIERPPVPIGEQIMREMARYKEKLARHTLVPINGPGN